MAFVRIRALPVFVRRTEARRKRGREKKKLGKKNENELCRQGSSNFFESPSASRALAAHSTSRSNPNPDAHVLITNCFTLKEDKDKMNDMSRIKNFRSRVFFFPAKNDDLFCSPSLFAAEPLNPALSFRSLSTSLSLLLRRLLKVLLEQFRPGDHAQGLPDSQEHPRDHALEQARGPLLLHDHRKDPGDGEVGLPGVGPGLGLDAGQL